MSWANTLKVSAAILAVGFSWGGLAVMLDIPPGTGLTLLSIGIGSAAGLIALSVWPPWE